MIKKIETTSVEERRKYSRKSESFKVSLCSSKYLLERDLLTKDISEDGICLLSPYRIEIGETVELGIRLPGTREPFTAKGKVVRRNEVNEKDYPFILGIQFTNIAPEDYIRISEHIRYYLIDK